MNAVAARDRVYVPIGEPVRVILPASEVCMHMRVTGKVMQVALVKDRPGAPAYTVSAQILREDGGRFGAPVLPGEAGFYQDGSIWYCYPAVGARP